jgi:sugar phosphate isomerase/epimerase
MRVGDVHLSYCSNIHPAHGWAETLHVLREPVRRVKADLSPDAPFGVGLRLSAEAARTLVHTPGELSRLRGELDDAGLYVFSLNGFPYGPFHGAPVKARVYEPDWRAPERARYTTELTAVLEALLPAGVTGSISTVPGCFAPSADSATGPVIGKALREQAIALAGIAQRGGPEIALALEPEPCCLLETIEQTVAFFQAHLLGAAAIGEVADALGVRHAQAETAIRRHLGVCLDTCHAAVEFEDPIACVDALVSAGIRIAKVQATTGLCVQPVDAARVRALHAFADPVYLHQVVARRGDELVRHLDLPEAFAAFEAGAHDDEWRVHFHVPVFLAEAPPFHNTQGFLARCLPAAIAAGCTHVEVETYTWDVLPAEHRAGSVEAAIAREIRFTRELLP